MAEGVENSQFALARRELSCRLYHFLLDSLEVTA